MKALLQVEISDSESDVTVTSHSLSSSLRPEEANQPSKHWQSESEKKNEDEFSFLKGPHETKVSLLATDRPAGPGVLKPRPISESRSGLVTLFATWREGLELSARRSSHKCKLQNILCECG